MSHKTLERKKYDWFMRDELLQGQDLYSGEYDYQALDPDYDKFISCSFVNSFSSSLSSVAEKINSISQALDPDYDKLISYSFSNPLTSVLSSVAEKINSISQLEEIPSHFLDEEKSIHTSFVEKGNQLAESKLKRPFIENLFQLINNSDFEFGYSNPAEEYIIEALEKYGPQAKEWINDIYNEYFYDSFIISSILRIIAHIEYNQIKPQGVTIAASAIFHDNIEIREYGIRCFENWEEPENLKILRNITKPSEVWLNDYLMDVIEELEAKKEEYNNALFCKKD